MRLAMVYPNKHSSESQMSLGLGYLASYILSKDDTIDIKVLDTAVMNRKEVNRFFNEQWDIAAVTVTSRTYKEAVEIARIFKTKKTDIPVIFGGPHVSIIMKEVMRESLIDFAIYGEGELTLDELLRLLKNSENQFNADVLSKVNGLIFRRDGNVVVNTPRVLIENLDMLPFPAFDLFPMRRYAGRLPLITSRGCPFACVFCASSQIWSRKWRDRSPENIIKEIKWLEDKFGPRPFEFHDDGFNMSLKRVNAICDQIIQEKINIPWGVRGFRADIVNIGVSRKMRRAGCSHVAIGIESANPRMLVRMGKHETIDQIERGIKILRSTGIDVIGQFMIGNPGETLETVKESVKFAKESGCIKSTFGTAVPFPGTALWKYVEDNGRFLVEPDVTRFEDMNPRIIFETPEFSAEERLKAIELVREAGFLGGRVERESRFRKIYKRTLSIYIPKLLPRKVVFHLYFLLRKLKRKLLLFRF